MPRPRQRVCLQDGLKLDLNRLARRDFIKFGANTGSRGITWNHSDWGATSGLISADMTDTHDAWLRIEIGTFKQQIGLVSSSRRYGGYQWFFVCPATYRRATVVWKAPGASRFCSRQAWGRQVAYASQFLDRNSRAHYGQSRIHSRLCSIGRFDPGEWDFPPKPKWMRWDTYNRYEQQFDQYEEILDYSCAVLVARLMKLKLS
jgi:hypothetical protein